MIPEDDIQTTHAPEEPNQPTVPSHPLRHLSNRPEPNSVIYDKNPPLSNPPIFDSTIGPSSAPDIPLRFSPLPFTPLTSPVKSNDSGLGFLCHAATPNAFAATSSTSPPVIGRPTSAKESQGYDDGVIDLTQTKDLPRHVPSMEENHLANELFRYPLIPMEWDLFENILKANINFLICYQSFLHHIYHTTRSELELSNKSLLQITKPKQWTTTYQMELLVHMLSARHSDILQRKHAALAPPTLNLVDIVLLPGKKWMEDVHTI
ncbi:hypothetical protein Bca52824_083042 [Brassica carinata]|uniref:Uncharacterized protein n=1 Tax=Brassica carinata TaxID=52824 RepID=A0A8X7TUV3_BRACI|nr:hypothetical protein Bca52824_083042 [Brassica carinata]